MMFMFNQLQTQATSNKMMWFRHKHNVIKFENMKQYRLCLKLKK